MTDHALSTPAPATPASSATPATSTITPPATSSDRLPIAGLLALASAAFITILTEALPAGLLPQMSAGLNVSEALVGQLVTIYALGSLLTAIPLTALTRRLPRRPLLLTAVGGFAAVNSITAFSTNYTVTLVARFVAGIFAGLLWALLAGYASRMVAPHLKGRAIAVAMVGAPLALSLGIPAGTFLGQAVGWQYAFAIMTALTVLLCIWTRLQVPNFPGQRASQQLGLQAVFVLPGVRPVLFVTLTFVLAHNMLYTYIVPLVARAGMAAVVDRVLLVFGISAVFGIWITGVLIDRWLRAIVLTSTAVFGLAAVVLGLWGDMPALVYTAIAAWGVGFGGAGTFFQTASVNAAGDAADVAQSMIVTVWNAAIAGGGIAGGMLLAGGNTAWLPWAVAALLAVAGGVTWQARASGFPPARSI